jgi:hypothetical protein
VDVAATLVLAHPGGNVPVSHGAALSPGLPAVRPGSEPLPCAAAWLAAEVTWGMIPGSDFSPGLGATGPWHCLPRSPAAHSTQLEGAEPAGLARREAPSLSGSGFRYFGPL